MNSPSSSRRWLIVALVSAAGMSGALTGSLQARTAPPAPTPASPAAPAPDALSGPKVEDRSAPVPGAGFGEKSVEKRRGAGMEIPMQVFMTSVRDALGGEAPEALRVTPEVEAKVRAIAQEFATAQRAFQRENGEAIRAARLLQRENGRGAKGGPDAKPNETKPGENKPGDEMRPGAPAGAPMGDPMMDEQERAAAMERARELREKAPKASDYQKQVWALLSEEQQKAVQVKLDAYKLEREKKAAEAYTKRQLESKKAPDARPGKAPGAGPSGAPAAPGPAPKRPGAARADNPEARQRMMAMLEKLPPEEREQMMARLEQRARERGVELPTRRGPGAGSTPGEDKPAPTSKDVPMPPPPAPPPAPAPPTPPSAPSVSN